MMRNSNSQAGFSLLELTTALGMLTVVMGVAVSLLNGFQSTYRADETTAEAQRNGRFAIARLEEIVRSAGCNPTSNNTVNAAAFLTFPNGNGSSAIRLKSDLDGDGLFTTTISSNSDVLVTSEDVTIQLNGTSLQMTDNTTAGSSPTTIADDIKSVTFTDPDGSARSVVIDLIAMPSGVRAGDPHYSQTEFVAKVRLRNR